MNVARLRSPVYALCLSILAVSAACGTADAPPNKSATSTGSGGSGTATGSGGGSAGSVAPAGTGGAGGAAGTVASAGGASGAGGADVGTGGSAGAPLQGPITPLPLTVSAFYAASGYMGDGMVATSIVADHTCPTRAPGNIGDCFKFVYTPQAVSTYGWGGVYWQSPANNWGTSVGTRIATGATKVSFYAAGAKGGEMISFFVGGITGSMFQDPNKVATIPETVTLTTTMTAYSIDLTGYTYDAIIGGFGWSAAATAAGDAGTFDPTPITFYVDGIQWVM